MLLVMEEYTCWVRSAGNFGHDPFLMFKVLYDKIQEIIGERHKTPLATGDSFSYTLLASFRVIKCTAGLAQLT